MKVRLEIIDDDGIESANVEFAGRHWKRRLLAFLGMVEDETEKISEPSSYSSNSTVQVAEQNTYQPQFVQQPGPVSFQQMGQQTAPVQQFQGQVQQQPVQQNVPQQFQQPMQQATVPLQYQQPVQQSSIPAMNQQYAPIYPQQSVMQDYPPQQYIQPTLPPGGMQQYGYGQPAKTLSPTVQQNMYSNPQTSPAVSNQPARRRTPLLQDRLNDMSLTINERLELFLKYEYPRVWFSSQDVQQHYERIYGAIKQSTVSTYLSRMFRKNLLERRGNRTQREYRYMADEQESTYKMEEMPGESVYHRIQY
ncbi:BlaI/MecI/CopY family transcriptional regulator [Methanolobus mangrovi]|uniref:BlaI/MecI/CopY family transcriptional regulator n=1 Tax=Methanolobus mangrovi TaxID=3072977 RepID=A0AA51YGN7_9EURY|nr:BlaI/MecI/CopY family transcriptional regulator [Methanolobus mangrovi]WMW22247.1 BlaI/MecI/CopY family transcriptional regulator [Methanolobus mangrovi]